MGKVQARVRAIMGAGKTRVPRYSEVSVWVERERMHRFFPHEWDGVTNAVEHAKRVGRAYRDKGHAEVLVVGHRPYGEGDELDF